MGVNIHPTAIIERGAELGSDVEVGAYSILGPGVKVGDRTKIGPHVVIEGNTYIGVENHIFQFASIGAAPQDLKFHGEPSTLTIGDRNAIREFVTIQPGTAKGKMATILGNNNLFMANCHVAHDCSIGSNNVFANSAALAGHVTVFNNVVLGGLVGIHQFCRVGDYSILGAGSMVAQDVPPYSICQGDRAVIRGVNVIALERAGMTKTEIATIRRAFRLLFSTVGKHKEKIAELPQELQEHERVKLIIDFIASSQRGIMNPPKRAQNTE